MDVTTNGKLKKKFLRRARNLARKNKDYSEQSALKPYSNSISGRWTPASIIPIASSTPNVCRNPDLTEPGHVTETQLYVDINRELKRLLIASVGNDLEHHMQLLAQEKSHLKNALDISVHQLNSYSEENDHLFIECDIWRSKFLASRVMIDELMNEKLLYSQHHINTVKSLKILLQEYQELTKHILLCHQSLSYCNQYFNIQDGDFYVLPQSGNILDIATSNSIAARHVLRSVSPFSDQDDGGMTCYTGGNKILELTAGQKLANKVLKSSTAPHSALKHTLPHLSLGEKHLLERNNDTKYSFRHQLSPWREHLSLHYCSKCKVK